MAEEESTFQRTTPADSCWYWQGNVDRDGYGRLDFRGKHAFLAHRAAWIIANGEIPEGLHVLHRCDEPACINPHHLFLGTQADNMLDKARKGRCRNGFSSGTLVAGQVKFKGSKNVPPEVAVQMRTIYAAGGKSQKQVGEMFGYRQGTVSRIVRQPSSGTGAH